MCLPGVFSVSDGQQIGVLYAGKHPLPDYSESSGAPEAPFSLPGPEGEVKHRVMDNVTVHSHPGVLMMSCHS